MEKALKEYRTYQAKTLSPVEKSYLDMIKTLQNNVQKNNKPGKK